jgi:hypothetical protein
MLPLLAFLSQAVTNFWQHMSADKEIEDGKRIVDAAKAAGTVKQLIWSGLEPVKEISGGKFTGVGHFDSKVRPLPPFFNPSFRAFFSDLL